MPSKQPPLFPKQTKLLAELGERLRLARLRRDLGIAVVCERAAISRMTLYRAERGEPAVALGTYLRILCVLKLEADIAKLAADDRLGAMIQDSTLKPRRTKHNTKHNTQQNRQLTGLVTTTAVSQP